LSSELHFKNLHHLRHAPELGSAGKMSQKLWGGFD